MFRATLISVLALVSSAAVAMTEGNYQGHGQWKDASGTTGKYTVTTVVSNGTISNTYNFNGQSKSFTMEANVDSAGFFPVLVNGVMVGSGYCLTVQCHFHLDSGMEETMTFWDGHLYRLGSKNESGKTIAWEESLEIVK